MALQWDQYKAGHWRAPSQARVGPDGGKVYWNISPHKTEYKLEAGLPLWVPATRTLAASPGAAKKNAEDLEAVLAEKPDSRCAPSTAAPLATPLGAPQPARMNPFTAPNGAAPGKYTIGSGEAPKAVRQTVQSKHRPAFDAARGLAIDQFFLWTDAPTSHRTMVAGWAKLTGLFLRSYKSVDGIVVIREREAAPVLPQRGGRKKKAAA